MYLGVLGDQLCSYTLITRKHKAPTYWSFVRGIHRCPWFPLAKGQQWGQCTHVKTSHVSPMIMSQRYLRWFHFSGKQNNIYHMPQSSVVITRPNFSRYCIRHCELSGICCKDIGENWPRYDCTALWFRRDQPTGHIRHGQHKKNCGLPFSLSIYQLMDLLKFFSCLLHV